MKNTDIREAKQRGFTLMEIAIVLGIAGLIFGAIWTAATSVSTKANISRADEQLGLIATSIQTMYAGRNVTYAALGSPGAKVDNTATYAGQNIFPTEMVAGTTVTNPWNGSVLAGLSGTNATTPVNFFIEYQNVPTDACAALVATNSLPGRESGLQKIVISNGATTYGIYSGTALPVSPATLSGVCTSANAPFTIDWYYKLGQGCAAGSSC